MDSLLFDISGTVAGRTVTRDALKTIAGSAQVSLDFWQGSGAGGWRFHWNFL